MRAFDRPPIPKGVPFAPGWHPSRRRRVGAGPLVTVTPNVNVNPNVNLNAPVNLSLGNLPLSLGIFAGAGVSFVIASQVPEKGPWKTIALIGGSVLALGGVANLFFGKESLAPNPAASPAGVSPPPAAPAAQTTDANGNPITSQQVNVPSSSDFDQVTGSIVSPTDTSTIDVSRFSSTYPVQIQLTNPTQNPVSLLLQFSGDETPSPIGSEQTASYSQQVTVQPGTQNLTIQMPTVTWGFTTTYVDVELSMTKAISAGSQAAQLDAKSFVIS